MGVMFGLDEREAPPQVRLRTINEPCIPPTHVF